MPCCFEGLCAREDAAVALRVHMEYGYMFLAMVECDGNAYCFVGVWGLFRDFFWCLNGITIVRYCCPLNCVEQTLISLYISKIKQQYLWKELNI